MAEQVVNMAMLQCSMGTTPAPLGVTSNAVMKVNNQLAATIMDYAPMSNIKSFGMCKSPANPTVAAATAAAQGVLTPMPCMPATAAPWVPGAVQTNVSNFPALLADAKCMCSYGGVVSINQSGQGVPTCMDT
ncbi:MAG: DUF4280 domain-containing protein [Planctomycetota bacterium]